MSKLVTIYGGSGFVGRYIARRMAKEGWRVRVAVRRPNEALFVRGYGAVGQLEPVLCNIRDENSVAAAMVGADAVINCVGIMHPSGRNTYAALQVEGAARVARLAAAAGVGSLVQISAIGADPEADSYYAATKGKGEAAVRAAFPQAVILRPSVIFGAEDSFFNRLGAAIRAMPVVPVLAAKTRLQPVHVDDVAAAAVLGATGKAAPGIYELGGPDVLSMAELNKMSVDVIGRLRVSVALPRFAAFFGAGLLDIAQTLTAGLFSNKTLTRDQVVYLGSDNVVSAGAKGFADLGLTPRAAAPLLEDYLWRFRPAGQYAAIKASARKSGA